MPTDDSKGPLPGMAKQPIAGGGFGQRFIRIFTRSATVTQAEMLTSAFFRIRLEGDALKHAAWRPGQAMQIVFGAVTARAYTPIWWDSVQGVLDIMVYAHEPAPGGDWAKAATPGDMCLVYGPRKSLDLTDLPRPALLLGDETSFALAASLRHTARQWQGIELVFEVNSVEDSTQVLRALGLPQSALVQRTAGDAHLEDVEAQVASLLAQRDFARVISTGKASSIQRIGRSLKRQGFSSSKRANRAYWSPGKKGMD